MNEFYDEILTCKQSADFESNYFLNSEKTEFEVIELAGKKIAKSILFEFGAILKDSPNILVLSGKGHNGADAIACAFEILKVKPNSKITLVFNSEINSLKPNTKEFARIILSAVGSIKIAKISEVKNLEFDLLIDGIVGMSLKLPMRGSLDSFIKDANAISAKLKASIDLPSGLSDEALTEENSVFKADVTYMTGIAKSPLFNSNNFKFSGRLRYVDLDFFKDKNLSRDFSIVTDRIFNPLKKLRKFDTDKRSYGHLFIFGGSANFPGAVLMNVKAALRAGVGLVSAFVPESIAYSLAAAEPACIWVPCPQDFFGGIALESFQEFKRFEGAQTAILAGSGLGSSPETLALISQLAKNSNTPIVLDADAIRLEILKNLSKREVLITPHMGEFLRLKANENSLKEFCNTWNLTTLLKSPVSKVCDGKKIACISSGGPILSRAGSGDILAGFAAALLARKDLNFNAFTSACCAAELLGKTSQYAFKKCGENAFSNSEIFNFIKDVLND